MPPTPDRPPPTVHCPPPTGYRRPATAVALRAYFTSGWAFFIPYLAAYLLYAWLKWPANSSAPSALGHGGYIPALLHVYWALHVINIVLAVIALRSWWREAKREEQRAERVCPPTTGNRQPSPADRPPAPATVHRPLANGNEPPFTGNRLPATGSSPAPLRPSPSALGSSPVPLRPSRLALSRVFSTAFSFQPSAFSAALRAVAPWLFLTLIFAIPGVYLEWPSDPWEHLRRITEWNIHPLVGDHSAGYKSFYFFAYSWVGWLAPAHLLSWLNVYYVGVCLLLAWQYYRLAKAVGLDHRWAFLFVVVNGLTFGNVCFSFYRYYGLSTSIYAQLGAVALTRIVLEWAKSEGRRAKGERQTITSEERTAKSGTRRLPLTALPAALRYAVPLWIGRLALCTLLLAFIAFNHVQGIGIASLSIAAICVWRLVEWKRSALWWLLATALALSVATILWYPHDPNIDSVFRSGGWLNAWYGFDLFSLKWESGGASDRMMQILGLFGLLNLVAGLILLRRNHVVGWLTLMPLIALSLPCFSLPLISALVSYDSQAGLITFHRMLLATPSGLALIYWLSCWLVRFAAFSTKTVGPFAPWCAVLVTVAAVTSIPSSQPFNNRLWHLITVTPQDLQLRHIVPVEEHATAHLRIDNDCRVVAPDAAAYALNATSPTIFPLRERVIGQAVAASLESAVIEMTSSTPTREGEKYTLNRDPLAKDRTAWIAIIGSDPHFYSGPTGFKQSSTAVQNPPGQLSGVMTSELIPIDHSTSYRLEVSLEQQTDTEGNAYLAVAWYDGSGVLLDSNNPKPAGAGFPRGWENGTFSYYGLIGNFAPTSWTTYRTTFGLGAHAIIPPNAKSIRVGALLNFNLSPGAVIRLTNIYLWKKTNTEPTRDGVFPQYSYNLFSIPPHRRIYSISSQAGELSHHWPAQEVATDLAGEQELEFAARSTGALNISDEPSPNQVAGGSRTSTTP